MKYMVTFTIRPENMKATTARFMAGEPTAEGAKIIGRWHEMGTGRGFSLVESDDPVAVSKLAIAWADLIDQKTVAVIEDAQIVAALQ
jgi:hypothetical protein